jgi:hypothetical protein
MNSCNNKEDTVKKPQEPMIKIPQDPPVNFQSNSTTTTIQTLQQTPQMTLSAGTRRIMSKKEYKTARKV